MDSSTDVKLETLRMRILSVKEAAERSRKAFIVASVASLAIIAVCWNSYFSWYRAFGGREERLDRSTFETAQKLEVAEQCSSYVLARDPPVPETFEAGTLSETETDTVLIVAPAVVAACCNLLVGPRPVCRGDCEAESYDYVESCRAQAEVWRTELAKIDRLGGSFEDHLDSRFFVSLQYPAQQATLALPRESTAGEGQLAEAWRESRWLSLDLLGLRVGVSDLAVLGCSGMLIIVVWFFFSVRREDHLIGELLQDAARLPRDLKWMVFHGVTSHLIFVYNRNDLPHRMGLPAKEGKAGVLRFLLLVLYGLPAVATLCIVFVDVWSLLWAPSPFRPSGDALLVSGVLEVEALSKLTQMITISTLGFAFTFTSCIRIILMERNINRNVASFYTRILGGKRAVRASKARWRRLKRWALDRATFLQKVKFVNQRRVRMTYIRSRRMRIFWLLIGTIAAYWLVYQILLRIFSQDGQLGEFAALMAGLAGNLWTAAVFSWLATGNFFPRSESDQPAPIGSGALQTGFIGVPLATALLSVAWLGSWFYVKLLYGSFQRTLLSGEEIGLQLSQVEVFKISAEFSGILHFGVTLPLMAATAFILGWACAVPLRFVAMLVPASLYCIIAAMISSGPDMVQTGRPPVYDVLREGFGAFADGITDTEVLVLWIIYVMLFPIGPVFYAAYGRIWTAIGFSLRRTIAAREDAVVSSSELTGAEPDI